jgi:hypothetical protein
MFWIILKNNFVPLNNNIEKPSYFRTMSNFSRVVIILFAVILSYSGVSNSSYQSLQPIEDAGSSSSFAIKKINLFYLHRQGENIINPVNYFPTPNLNNPPNDVLGHALSNEAKIRNVISRYFACLLTITRSLSTGDIIFPFHYFW